MFSYTKLRENEYIQNNIKSSNDGSHYERYFSPTYIKTYENGAPSSLCDIQAINYTKSGVTIFKDYENNCCIDIYDTNQNNPYKCRIIGTNGRIHYSNKKAISVYNLLSEAGSIVENKQKLIFIDFTGLYIVNSTENSINEITYKKIFNGQLEFKGTSIFKVSADDGKRTIDNKPIDSNHFAFNSSETNSNALFCFNCSKEVPLSMGSLFAPITKYYPLITQIEKITKVKLNTVPPSERSAKKRIADIIGVHEEQIFIKDGKAYLIEVTENELNTITETEISKACINSITNYFKIYNRFIPLINDVPNDLIEKSKSLMISWYINSPKKIIKGNLHTVINIKKINSTIALEPWENI